jgi:hypothetical protein
MAMRRQSFGWLVPTVAAVLLSAASAHAQVGMTLKPIPAAECQKLAAQAQEATGIKATAAEDDFTDLTSGVDGRSCHISGSASDLAIAAPAELMEKAAKPFAGWKSEATRSADGPNGGEKGYVMGNRIATIQVNWEPGPGVVCSDKLPLSSCTITPQQKLWNVVIDVVEQSAK